MRPTDYCLTCGGTGRRGNLSGKKKCHACQGTGGRTLQSTKNGRPHTPTVCDIACITIPAMSVPWPTLELSGTLLDPKTLEGVEFRLEKKEDSAYTPENNQESDQP